MAEANERNYSSDTRLAILEEAVRRVEKRLDVVSERTHTLINAGHETNLLADEARVQRTAMISKIDKIEGTIDILDSAILRNGMTVEHHVAICATRSARLEKIAWALLSIIIAVLGFLIIQFIQYNLHVKV